MARKQTFIIRCDRAECTCITEVDDQSHAPEGWLLVQIAVTDPKTPGDFKYDRSAAFEFCSLRCAEKWSAERRRFLNEGARPNGPDGPREAKQEEVIGAFGGDTSAILTSREVQELSGLPQSTVDRWLVRAVHEGTVDIVGDGSPRHYRLAAVAAMAT